jgi:hypothetical protein
VDVEDSLQFSDLQGLSNLQLENENHDPECVDVVAAYVMSSPHFQTCRKRQSAADICREGQQKDSDQQSVLYVSPADLEQPAFNSEISKDSFQHLFNLQLDQQSKEVLLLNLMTLLLTI